MNRIFYAQNKEDLFIKKLFETLNKKVEWVCEFGAWNGMHLSNTFTFVSFDKANAVYIEADKQKFKSLKDTADKYPNIIPINDFVCADKSNHSCLTKILNKTNIPKDFDVLSIDINSNDLDVWESLEFYEPICVIIEINNLIPPGVYKRHNDFTEDQIKAKNDSWLNSFSSTIDVGLKKGYIPIKHIGWNLVFVNDKYIDSLSLNIDKLETYDNLFNFRWIHRENRKKAKDVKRNRKRLKRGQND